MATDEAGAPTAGEGHTVVSDGPLAPATPVTPAAAAAAPAADDRRGRKARRDAALADLRWAAAEGVPPAGLLERACTIVVAGLAHDLAALFALEPGGDTLRLRAAAGWRPELVGHATVRTGSESQAGYTLLVAEPVIVADLRTETRFRVPPVLFEHGAVSGLSVVVGSAAGPWGVLATHATQRREYTPDDVAFVEAAAEVLAQAL